MTLGSQTRGQTTLTRRRRPDAVEAAGFLLRRPKGRRRAPTRSWEHPALIGGGGEARGRRKRRRDELCGCRSSGKVEPVARGHGKGRAVVLQVPGNAVSVVDKVVWPMPVTTTSSDWSAAVGFGGSSAALAGLGGSFAALAGLGGSATWFIGSVSTGSTKVS